MSESCLQHPSRAWQKADIHTYALYEALLGRQPLEAGGVYWRQVRPMFYRPLLPFKEYSSASVVVPAVSRWGAFQHAVPEGEPANSYLNVLLFDNNPEYSVQRLDYNRRRQVKSAERHFTIRPIKEVEEFKERAYPVYLSFCERTRYAYGARRRHRDFFNQWSDALFKQPALMILGGYRGAELGGVSVSLLVEDTLIYAMFFCDTELLRLGLSDLMLHAVRDSAARDESIRQIYTGMSHEKNDRFYLLRGGRCVSMRARLVMNPLVSMVIRHANPKLYARLLGGNK